MSASSLASMARQLGGDVVGQQILCPGPGHSKRDRSLSVRLSTTTDDGFVVFSHASDDVGACKDHVRQVLGWTRPEWQHRRRDVETSPPASPRHQPIEQKADHHEAEKIARAVAIWNEAHDPSGTVIETYLVTRKLELPWEAAGQAIRFHPACPWFDEAAGRSIRVPAMVCAMRNMLSEDITAIHRTRLTLDGQKVDRKMLGKASGAAMMLMPMSACGVGLAIGEGVETTIAGMMIGWRSAWALGSVGAIERLPLLTAVQSLVLLAETGDGGASERACRAAGNRYAADGREVILVVPRCEGDANDALRQEVA